MSIEEAGELGRRAIYHATFRDGASGGVASGTPPVCLCMSVCTYACFHELICVFNCAFLSVYYVGANGWTKLSGDDVSELHNKYYPTVPTEASEPDQMVEA